VRRVFAQCILAFAAALLDLDPVAALQRGAIKGHNFTEEVDFPELPLGIGCHEALAVLRGAQIFLEQDASRGRCEQTRSVSIAL
jgi:hypothetical protein